MMSIQGYLGTLDQSRYGGTQEDFAARSNQIISHQVGVLTEALASNPSTEEIVQIFEKMIAEMWTARSQIAMDNQSEECKFFGFYRPQLSTAIVAVTPVGKHNYNKCRRLAAKGLSPMLEELEPNVETQQFAQLKVAKEVEVLGHTYLVEAKLINPEDLKPITLQKAIEILDALGVEHSESSDLSDLFMLTLFDREHGAFFAQKFPELHEKTRIAKAYIHLQEKYPSRDENEEYIPEHLISHPIVVTHRMRFKDAPERDVKISEFVTGAFFGRINGERVTPQVWMDNQSLVGNLLHQDISLIEETLKSVAHVFADAIQATELEDLKKKVAVLRWTYANCMPCLRGDGAVGDWLEMIVYTVKGYQASFKPGTTPSGYPLVMGLDKYLKTYNVFMQIQEAS